MSEAADDLMIQFLTDHDQPCPDCNYNLRNLGGSRCPECGAELILRVNLVEPRQKLLIAGLIGLSAGTGFNGLLIIYLILVEFLHSEHLDAVFFVVVGGGFLVMGLLLFLWLGFWRRIRRLGINTRRFLVMGSWAATLIDIVIFTLTIR